MSPTALGRKNKPTLAMPSRTKAPTITAPAPAAAWRYRAGNGSAAKGGREDGNCENEVHPRAVHGRERGMSGGADLRAAGG